MAQKKFDAAMTLYSEVLAEREIAWAKIGLGRVLYQLKSLPEALAIFNSLVKEQPNVIESYDWLAKIQLGMGEHRRAQETLEAAVSRSPKAVLRQMELGRIAMFNHSYLIAEQAFKKAITLASDSCYKTPDNYLQYVRSLLVKLDGENSKFTRDTFKEGQLYLARVRKEFPKDDRVTFRANLIEGLMCFNHKKIEDSDRCIDRAEQMMAGFSGGQRIAFADEFVATLAQVRRFENAEAFVHDLQKQMDKPALANRLRQRIMDGHKRERSEALGLEALSLYERGKIMEAQSKFAEAAEAPGASTNLLLNVARICLELTERQDLNQAEWRRESRVYLDRLTDLDRGDHRFDTLQDLETRYENLPVLA